METLTELGMFWERYWNVVVVSVFWMFVLWLFLKALAKRVVSLEQTVEDLSASNRRNIEIIAQMEDAYSAARNEARRWMSEVDKLRAFISKKKEFRLRNGWWCTEEQYLAEKNGLTVVEQLEGSVVHDNIHLLDEVIGQVEATESVNAGIDEIMGGMIKELEEK
jgi:hypothetical protein